MGKKIIGTIIFFGGWFLVYILWKEVDEVLGGIAGIAYMVFLGWGSKSAFGDNGFYDDSDDD